MKFLRLALLLLAWVPSLLAQGAPAASPKAELDAILAGIKAKFAAHKEDTKDYQSDLDAISALEAKYQGQKSEDVAEISLLKAQVLMQVFEDTPAAKKVLAALVKDYPSGKAFQQATRMLSGIERSEKAELVKTALIGKPAPEVHFKWASLPDVKKLSDLKGKVVILDFWATWCGPCIASFDHLRELNEKFKDRGVVVLGVTSIQGMVANLKGGKVNTQDDPKKEIELLGRFIEEHSMTWKVAVSDEEVFNPDFGVVGIPTVAVLGADGTVKKISHPSELTAEVVENVLKEAAKS